MSAAIAPASETLIPVTAEVDHCAICMQAWASNEGKYTLGCKHSYHPRCITTWLVKSQNCPYCRTPIDEVDRLPEIEPHTCGLTKAQWSRCARTFRILLVSLCFVYLAAMTVAGMTLLTVDYVPTAGGKVGFALGSAFTVVIALLYGVGVM